MSSNFGFKATDKMGYYFISYNTEDAFRVARICNKLNDIGVQIWYDEGIPHNAYWESVLAEKIDKSKGTIFFITKNIFEKGKIKDLNEIYTYKEYDLARRYKKKRIIVLLDEILDRDVPYSLMSWWQEIDPKVRQVILSYKDDPQTVADKIVKELNFGKDRDNQIDEPKNNDSSQKRNWGPERKMFSMETPASYATINSIKNNPTIGDERRFVQVGEINPNKSQLSSGSLQIKPNNRYLVYIYCHNACSSAFFDKKHNYSGVARGIRLSCRFPDRISPEKPGFILSTIFGDNTKPEAVWCKVDVYSDEPIRLKLEAPAKIYNDWETNKSILSMDLFSEKGTFLGTNKLNGIMFGEESHCVVAFVLKAELETQNNEALINEIKELDKSIQAKYGKV